MGDAVHREVINVEYWGSTNAPAGPWSHRYQDNTYKSLRLVAQGGKHGWLFNRWCMSNFTELYDTVADPYELHNLAMKPDESTKRLTQRLSGLLLVTKSCGQSSCRRPWDVLADSYKRTVLEGPQQDSQVPLTSSTFESLEQAMHHGYDDFFAQLPTPGFQFCRDFQDTSNEGPYFPAESEDLGRRYRRRSVPDETAYYTTNGTLAVEHAADQHFGDTTQRHAKFAELSASARELSDSEMGWEVQIDGCELDPNCWELYEDD